MPLAGGEVQFDAFATDVLQERADEFGIQVGLFHGESQRIHPFVQNVECLGVGSLCVVRHNVLPDEPGVVVFLVSPDVGKFARQSFGRFQSFNVFLAVERLYLEPFVGFPYQLLFVIGPLQVCHHFVCPFLGRHRREI